MNTGAGMGYHGPGMPDTEPATHERGARVAVLGEVLFDCFPDGPRLGGAPFNVAWHLAALGLKPDFISRVGADALGADIRRAMAAHGMTPELLQEDKTRPTGQVRVTLDGRGGHAFEILPDQAYDHIEAAPVLAHLGSRPPALAYFGTLCLRSPGSRAAILGGVAACAGTRFLDVNLRDGCWTDATVGRALETATVVKLNDAELDVLGPRFAPARGDPDVRAEALRRAFDLAGLCVTRGDAGAAWYADGVLHRVLSPPTRVVDTVGAGDGFAALLIAGLLAGDGVTATLERAAAFASAICEMRGACPADPAFYTPFRAPFRAPTREAPPA
jgi:fructokinase